MSTIWQSAVALAVSDGILNLKGTTQQASSERIGRYAYFGNQRHAGLWLGIHFALWQLHGGTPLWIYFSGTNWGHSTEARNLIEPWASKKGVFTTEYENGFALAIDIPFGEEKEIVIRAVVDRLRYLSEILSVLEPIPFSRPDNESADSTESI